MRNKLFSLMLFFCVLIFSLYGCKSKETIEDMCFNEASEIRTNFYVDQVEDLVLTFSSGVREKDYNLDASHIDNNIEFGLLTLYSVSKKYLDEQSSEFLIVVCGESINNKFEKNPFDGSLVCDICKEVDAKEFEVEVKVNGEVYNFNLVDQSAFWNVDYYDAFNIACVNNKKILSSYVKNNKFEGEIYIKVSYNFSINLNGEWYIKFLMKNKTIHVLVDKNSGSIISNIIE